MFIGPAVVLTNGLYPRAIDVTGKLKRPDDWDARGVVVRESAALGAIAVVVDGRWAVGAVVTRDVPDFALVAGLRAADRVGRQQCWRAAGGSRGRRVALSSDRRVVRACDVPDGIRYVPGPAASVCASGGRGAATSNRSYARLAALVAGLPQVRSWEGPRAHVPAHGSRRRGPPH